MRSRIVRWGMRLIGPVLLVFFLWHTDLTLLATSLQQVDWWPVVISLVLMPFFIIVKAWRWRIILHELDLNPPGIGYLSSIYTVGLFLGSTTPGQSGDFAKSLYLRTPARPMPSLLFSIFVERLCDVAAMAVMALIGLASIATTFPADAQQSIQIATVALAVLIFSMLPAILMRTSRQWVLGVMRLLVPGRWRESYDRITEQFRPLNIGGRAAGMLVVATLGSALSTAIRIMLLFWALGLERIPLPAILGSTGQISLLQALPISVSGLGVREAVLIGLLSAYDYASAFAIALSGLFMLINIEHIIVGFLFSLRYPIPTHTESTP